MLLKGKRGLVTGIANDMSIAYSIARLAKDHGAELAITYQGEVLEKRVKPLAATLGTDFIVECDVTNMVMLDSVFNQIQTRWGQLDFVVHSLAFADKNELRGRYIDTSLDNFLISMNVSVYSLTAMVKRAEPLMKHGGSIIALTYYGSQKVMPSYNVMGVAKAALETSVKYLASDIGGNNIRVNAISAGPIRTLASSAISDFKSMLKTHQDTSPLKRNMTQEDIAGPAVYLLSDMSSGVTGEIHYVDGGYNVMGVSLSK